MESMEQLSLRNVRQFKSLSGLDRLPADDG